MKDKVYNKIVRTNVPEIIKSEGKTCYYIELYTSTEEDLAIVKNLLKDKIIEEAQEVRNAKNKWELLEEIADLLDVIDELLRLEPLGAIEQVKTLRAAKNITKGAFSEYDYSKSQSKYIKLLKVENE